MTTARRHRLGFTVLFGASGIFVVACIFLADSLHDSARASRGDQWRRTAQGWERVSDWQVSPRFHEPASSARLPDRKDRRWDSHPAALALVQMVAIALGYYAFPTLRSSANRPTRWRTRIAHSFRASMFG